MKTLAVAIVLARVGGLIAFQPSAAGRPQGPAPVSPTETSRGSPVRVFLHDEAHSWWGDTSVVRADQVPTYVKHRRDASRRDVDLRDAAAMEANAWWSRSDIVRDDQVQTYVKPRRSERGRWEDYEEWNSNGDDWGNDYDAMRRDPFSDRRGPLYDRYTPDQRRYYYGQRHQEPHGLGPRRTGMYQQYGPSPSRRQAYEPEYYYDGEPLRRGPWYDDAGSRRGPLGELSNDESKSWWGQTYVVDDRQVQTFVKPRRYGTAGDGDYRAPLRPVTESDSWWGRSDVLDDRQVQTYVSRRSSDTYNDRRGRQPEDYYDAEVL